MARWGVSTWLVFARSLQILGTLVSAGLNGFLLVYIHINKLGLTQTMFSVEIMTCIIIIYTAIVLLLQHTGRRRIQPRTGMTVAFIVGDVIFTGITIGIITMLARAGVPSNCGGLTRSDFSNDDAPNIPPDGYSTIRFSYGDKDQKGVLDKLCGLERGYYFVSVALIFSYMVTVTLSVLRLCENLYTRNSVVNDQLAREYELRHQEAKSKVHGYPSTTQLGSPSSPIQEGVTSPRSASSRTVFQEPTRQATLTVSPMTSPAVTVDPAREGLLIDQQSEQAAEAAMVTDGYRQHEPGMPMLPPYTPGESSRFMAGHANEDNEMRLSDYVKGETRAQDMKNNL